MKKPKDHTKNMFKEMGIDASETDDKAMCPIEYMDITTTITLNLN